MKFKKYKLKSYPSELSSKNIDFSIGQNVVMFEKYRELARTCPNCRLLMSPQASMCMSCRTVKRARGENSVFLTHDDDFKKKMQEKIKELAKEQGVSLKTLGFDEE